MRKSIFLFLIFILTPLLCSGCVSYLNSGAFISHPNLYGLGDSYGPSNDPEVNRLLKRLNDCEKSDEVSEKYACVSLLYGTNRVAGTPFYGNAPQPQEKGTKLGEVVVSIPNNHQIGKDIRGASGPVGNKATRIREQEYALWDEDNAILELEEDLFKKYARFQLEQSNRRSSFVFIHGFNVPFQNAAYNAAQLKTDLKFEGPVFFYSWPSNGNKTQYLSDQQDADVSAEHLAEFLKIVKDAVGTDTEIHIIAHSMGNRVLGQALSTLRKDLKFQKPLFKTGVFASADLDENLFRSWIVGPQNSKPLFESSLIYVTDDDRALQVSKKILALRCDDGDRKYRVGLVTKRNTCKSNRRRYSIFGSNFSTIDLSDEPGEKIFKIFGKNHNKYTKSPKIICHLNRIFDGGPAILEGSPDFLFKVITLEGEVLKPKAGALTNKRDNCFHTKTETEFYSNFVTGAGANSSR